MLAVIGICASACDSSRGSADVAVDVRDSLGITIVEYEAMPAELPAWSLAAEPEVAIGEVDGAGPTVLGQIASVVRQSDGTIVIGESLSREIRAFGPSGEHLWTAGGQGEGPGEFSRLESVHLTPGDSLVGVGGRVGQLFAPDGTFVRPVRLAAPPEGVAASVALGRVSDGGFFARGLQMPVIESGYQRGSETLLRLDPEGTSRQISGELPSGEAMVTVTDRGYSSYVIPMGRRTQWAAGPDVVAVTTQDRWEIRRFDAETGLDLIVRVLEDPIPVDDEVRNRYAQHGLQEIDPEQREDTRRSRMQMRLPETLPAVGELRVDVSGRIWVQEYLPPYEDRDPAWWVVGPDGHLVAEAQVPRGFSPHQIDAAHAVGVTRDAFDVPFVEVRRIVRE